MAPVTVGQGIAAGPLGKAQLVKIARKRSLGDGEATAAQLAAQFVLVGNQGTGHEVPYRIVSLDLHFSAPKDRSPYCGKIESAARSAAAALA